MAIKRIAFKSSRGVMDCLKCQTRLSKTLQYPKRIKCPHCGTVNLITETEAGHISVIDEKYIGRFGRSAKV